jgi:hypothetical protein
MACGLSTSPNMLAMLVPVMEWSQQRRHGVDMRLLEQLHIDKTRVTIADLHDHDQHNDWADKSPSERLAGLEFLRQMWHDYDPSTARLPRVYTIIERA